MTASPFHTFWKIIATAPLGEMKYIQINVFIMIENMDLLVWSIGRFSSYLAEIIV